MIKYLWPEIVTAIPPPQSPYVFEASRLCVDHTLPAEQPRLVINELVCAYQQIGLINELEYMIGVMPPNIRGHVLGKAGNRIGLRQLALHDRPHRAHGIAEVVFGHRANLKRKDLIIGNGLAIVAIRQAAQDKLADCHRKRHDAAVAHHKLANAGMITAKLPIVGHIG
jgi:hypothetical protein